MSDNGSTLKERISDSLPAKAKIANVVGDKLVDAIAIAGMVLLAIFTDLDAYFAAAVIALIAGVSLGETLKKRGGPGGLVMALGYSLIEIARRGKGAVVLLSVMTLASCNAGAYHVITSALDVAKTIAEQRTGRSLDELPGECDSEYVAATDDELAKVLVLCEFTIPAEGEAS